MAEVGERDATAGMSTGRGEGLEHGLVPTLPDDVALQCLLRVPVQAHSQLQGVCRKWRDLVNSSEFYERRKKEGTTGRCVCLLQTVPQDSPWPHPSFGVSSLNEKNQWERLPPIPGMEDRGLPLFCRFAAVGGHLVVLGGWDPSTMEELRSVHIFSFSSRLWRRGAHMPSARSFFSCGVLNGDVLIAGGHDRNKNALRSAARYNLQDDRWEPLPDMHTERDECASAVLDGHFLVISGYATCSQGEFRRDAEIFHPDRNAWTPAPDLWSLSSKPVAPSTVTAAAGKLFALHRNQLLCYSPEQSLWQVVDAIPEGSTGISVAVCATGSGDSIVVNGPSNADDGSYRTLVYRLPPDLPSRSRLQCKGRWESVPVHDRFLGIAHVACAVEV